MWDNPRLLNAAAGALTALALMVFTVAAMQLLLRSELFPLREMTVRGALTHTPLAEIEQAAAGRVTGNFFAVDLAEVRAALEGLPWVRRVEVRRIWPDRLEATLEEHVPFARWAAGAGKEAPARRAQSAARRRSRSLHGREPGVRRRRRTGSRHPTPDRWPRRRTQSPPSPRRLPRTIRAAARSIRARPPVQAGR